MFNRLFKSLRYRSDHDVPSIYDPKLHYNCFIESVPSQIRPALYKELLNKGQIRVSHRLPDGRLQLSLSDLNSGLEALNSVSKDNYNAYALTKEDLIKLMIKNPDLELTFLWKPGNMYHAETHRFSQMVLRSEDALRKGVSYQKSQQYQRAIECYEEAIRIEPLDFRAWNNKIVALSQVGKNQEALRVADEILRAHPDVAILWDTKCRVLSKMGRALEAGECLSRAISLDNKIEQSYKIDEGMNECLQQIMNDARQAGKNPETNVELWFGKFAEYAESAIRDSHTRNADSASKNIGKAIMCLQMAAKIAPDHLVLSDASTMVLLPPGDPLLDIGKLVEYAKVEPLRDFYLRLEQERAERQTS